MSTTATPLQFDQDLDEITSASVPLVEVPPKLDKASGVATASQPSEKSFAAAEGFVASADAATADIGSLPAKSRLLDPGYELTLRPMRYPVFYEMYRDAIKNTWTVEEVDFSDDFDDLRRKLTDEERHLINRLVAFFATGDTIVANNLVINLYQHINAPEARMYLSRQLYEEALHIQFYLTLLDNYIPDPAERHQAFAAVESIPSIRQKAEFCFRWINSVNTLERLETKADRQQFLLNLICFATCIEGLFFSLPLRMCISCAPKAC